MSLVSLGDVDLSRGIQAHTEDRRFLENAIAWAELAVLVLKAAVEGDHIGGIEVSTQHEICDQGKSRAMRVCAKIESPVIVEAGPATRP